VLKAIKWLIVSALGLAGLVVGAYFGFALVVSWSSEGVGSDGGAGSAFLRSQFHDGPRYYELTANLEVEGKPIEITRVIECLPYFAHRLGNYFQKRWYTNQEAMTHRLDDGSGVIVVVPKLCEEFADPQPANAPPWKAFPDLPDDFVPLILWTANADDPAVLEGYHSFESVERPNSRVRFKGIALRNDANLKPRKYSEEFGVWNNAKFGGLVGGQRPRIQRNYRGYYLAEVGEEEWRKVSELNAALKEKIDSGFLESDTRRMVERNFKMQSGFDQYAINGILMTRQTGTRSTIYGSEFSTLNQVHSFELQEKILVYRSSSPGVITYLRKDVREKLLYEGNGEIKINILNNIVFWPIKKTNELYYYSSGLRKIYHMNVVFVDFSPVADRIGGTE